jgi:hypothetical protein
MSFSDEDIRAMVKAGQYSDAKDADTVTQVLIERRDKIARFWLSRANPLDGFSFSGEKLSFKDLEIEYGFASKEGTIYHMEVMREGKKAGVARFETKESFFNIQPEWISTNGEARIILRVGRASTKELSPAVTVLLNATGVQGIQHED